MSVRKKSSSLLVERKHAVETGVKMFNFVGSLMILALERKKNNNKLSHSEKTIMEILGNQLNQTHLDKNSLKSLVKALKSVKGKRKMIRSSKRGGAYRRERSSSPVRSLPPRSSPRTPYPERYNVNYDPIILDLERKERYAEIALVGVVLMTICYGIISLL